MIHARVSRCCNESSVCGGTAARQTFEPRFRETTPSAAHGGAISFPVTRSR